YFLMLGPHGFCWFSLEPSKAALKESADAGLPALTVRGGWEKLFRGAAKDRLQALLPDYLQKCRWFGGKAYPVRTVTIEEVIPVPGTATPAALALLRVEYIDRDADLYVLPLTHASGDAGAAVQERSPQAVLSRLKGEGDSILYDAVSE